MKRSNQIPQSNVVLRSVLKQHTVGLDKAISPAQTVRNVQNNLKRIQLDLVRETVRIDSGRLDIPVYVCMAGRDCNIPTPKTMGKGPTPDQSAASALMEMVERFSHANFPRPENHVRGTFRDVEGHTIPEDDFFLVPNTAAKASEEEREEFASLPFAWVPAYSLVRKKDFLMPYEWFADIQGTNGLSAGNTPEEAVLQALCEVVERHVCAVASVTKEPLPTIDLSTVRDPVAKDLVDKYARNRIKLQCKDFTLNTGIPTVAGIAVDTTTFPNSEIVYCAGSATNPEKALIRVLTEIQQMAVDSFRLDYYAGGILPKFRAWQEASYLFDDEAPVSIESLPDVSSNDLLEEIERCTAALQRIGFEPYVINITHPLLNTPAVFVLMPGSELYDMSSHELNTTYFLGRRLELIGRREEAMDKFRLSKECYPESMLHCTHETANCLKAMGRWEDAMNTYKEALRYGPDRAMQLQIFRSLEVCFEKIKGAAQRSATL